MRILGMVAGWSGLVGILIGNVARFGFECCAAADITNIYLSSIGALLVAIWCRDV